MDRGVKGGIDVSTRWVSQVCNPLLGRTSLLVERGEVRPEITLYTILR
jgi:hypothetical protein